MKRTCNWILAELYIKLVIRATLRQLYERLLVVSGNNNVFCSRRVVEPFLMIERRGRVFFPSGKIYTLTRYINFYVKWSEKNFVHRRKNNLKDKLVISLHNRVLICKISFSLIDSAFSRKHCVTVDRYRKRLDDFSRRKILQENWSMEQRHIPFQWVVVFGDFENVFSEKKKKEKRNKKKTYR